MQIKRIPDWTEVVSKSTARTTPEMEDAIKESEFGPSEIAYYLAKHPREAERIYNLSPARRRIAKSSGWKPEIRKAERKPHP